MFFKYSRNILLKTSEQFSGNIKQARNQNKRESLRSYRIFVDGYSPFYQRVNNGMQQIIYAIIPKTAVVIIFYS
jgi:hypothetical protein